WNYKHLLEYYADVMRPDDALEIVNLEREGSPLREGNWASFVLNYLVRNPHGRVYALGSIPNIENDPFFVIHGAGPIQMVEWSLYPRWGNADGQRYEYIYHLMNERFKNDRHLPSSPNSIRFFSF